MTLPGRPFAVENLVALPSFHLASPSLVPIQNEPSRASSRLRTSLPGSPDSNCDRIAQNRCRRSEPGQPRFPARRNRRESAPGPAPCSAEGRSPSPTPAVHSWPAACLAPVPGSTGPSLRSPSQTGPSPATCGSIYPASTETKASSAWHFQAHLPAFCCEFGSRPGRVPSPPGVPHCEKPRISTLIGRAPYCEEVLLIHCAGLVNFSTY